MRNVVLSAFTKLGQDGLATYANNVITLMMPDPQFQLKELASGKTYQFQFRAIGNKGLVSPWSSTVKVLVS
jgi:hypothetical protein